MDPQKCHDGLTFDRGLAATLVACHGAMKFMESSKLMGEMSLLATSELVCCEKICACLRCMGAKGARGCLDPTDGAKDLFQMIDSLVWKLKSNVVRSTIGKEIPRQTWHRFYCNILQYHLAHRIIYMSKLLNPMDAASVLGDPSELSPKPFRRRCSTSFAR